MADAVSYAWIIDRDHMPDPLCRAPSNGNARGMTGPRGAPDVVLNSRLGAPSVGLAFRMSDDDGVVMYSGRLYVPGVPAVDTLQHAQGFEPLDDFGAPNAGCTCIEYKDAAGGWTPL